MATDDILFDDKITRFGQQHVVQGIALAGFR